MELVELRSLHRAAAVIGKPDHAGRAELVGQRADALHGLVDLLGDPVQPVLAVEVGLDLAKQDRGRTFEHDLVREIFDRDRAVAVVNLRAALE